METRNNPLSFTIPTKSCLINSTILYILMLKQQLKKISLIWMLILPSQVIYIFIMSIQCNIIQNNYTDSISSYLSSFWNKMDQDDIGYWVIVLWVFILLLLAFLFGIFVIMKKPMGQLDRHNEILHKLVFISAILVTLLEFTIYPISWFTKIILTSIFTQMDKLYNLNNASYAMLPLCLVTIFAVGLVNKRIRILGPFFYIFVITNGISQNFNLVSAAFGLFLCLFVIEADENLQFLMIKKHNVRKIWHLVLAGYFIWAFIDKIGSKLMSQSQKQIPYITYIYLLCSLIISLIIGYIKFTYKVDSRLSPVIKLSYCIKQLLQNPSDINSKLAAIDIQYQCHKFLNQHNQNNKINPAHQILQKLQCHNTSKMQQSKHADQDKYLKYSTEYMENLYALVNIMISEQYKKQPTFQANLNLIKCMLMIEDKNMFQILQYVKDISQKYYTQDIFNRYQIIKLVVKLQNLYLKKFQTSQHSVVHMLRQVDRLNNIFYRQYCQQIQYIYKFWEIIITQKLRLEQHEDIKDKIVHESLLGNPEDFITKIKNGMNNLQVILKQIQPLSDAALERRVLDYLKLLSIQAHQHNDDVYQQLQIDKPQATDIKSLAATNDMNDYSCFMQVTETKITQISLKLATQLGYKKFDIIGQPLYFLMPNTYQNDIQAAIKGNQQPILKFNHLVPIRCSDNSIVLKRFICYFEVDCHSGYRIIFHFYNSFRNKDPIIIYNTATNSISHYNKAFIDVFNLDAIKLQAKMKNQCLNPDQIFTEIQLSDKNTQAKLSQTGFETEYNCKMFISKIGTKSANKIQNIRLNMIEKEKQFMVLKIMKGYRVKSVAGQFKKQEELTSKQLQGDQLIPTSQKKYEAKKYQKLKSLQLEDESIYCPIQNPYESKIMNKKAQLTKSTKFTYKFYAVLSMFVIVLFLLGQSVMFLQINYEIDNAIQVKNQNALSQFTQYKLLILAYQGYLSQYLVRLAYPFLKKKGFDVDGIIDGHKKNIQKHLSSFQKLYLRSMITKKKNPVSYNLKFKYFNITTDTSKSNFFDFQQNLLQYESNDAAMFLMNNYPSFSRLISEQNKSQRTSYEQVNSFINVHYILSSVFLCLIIFCMIFGLFVRIRIFQVTRDIQFIFKLINFRNLSSLFCGLASLNTKVTQIRQQGIKQQQKYQNIFSLAYQIQQKSKPSQKQQNLPQFNEKDNENLCQDSLQNQNILQQQKKQKNNVQNQDLFIVHKKQKKLSLKQSNFYIYLGILFGILLLIALQVIYLKQKVDEQFQVLSFKIQDYRITQNMLHLVLQTQFIVIAREVNLSKKAYSQNISDTFFQTLTINNQKLPNNYFAQFSKYYFQKNSGQLCDLLRDKTRIQFNYTVCNLIGGGITKYGTAKTIQLLTQLIKYCIKNRSWAGKSPFSPLMTSQDIIYTQNIVLAVNDETLQQFTIHQNKFKEVLKLQAKLMMGIGCLFCLVLIGASIYLKNKIYKASGIGVDYFLILPKKVLLQNQVIDHLRKNDILNRISSI